MRPLIALLFVLGIVPCGSARGDEALAAVASNFADVIEELAPRFQKETGHLLRASFGASGKFAAQIENGAPFDLFLSADAESPRRIEEKGLGVEGTRFVYAVGRLALWSPLPGHLDERVIAEGRFSRIAIANPKTAPYGRAAVETMQRLGAWPSPKVVQGENVAQTFQFVETGNAQFGFIALAQVLSLDEGRRGSYWEVPPNYHAPIRQEAILLKRGADKGAARAFVEFLKRPDTRAVIARFGYGTP